jgi:hypothetical protein
MPWTNAPKIKHISWTVLLGVLLITGLNAKAELSREIRYKSWDGSNWRARRAENRFEHSPEHSSRKYFDTAIRYLGWDRRKFAARWDEDRFLIAPEGDFGSGRTQSFDYIAFQSWDEQALTAQWSSRSASFEVKPAAGVLIVGPSTGLNRFNDLNSRHRVCGSTRSLAALKGYVKKFGLESPQYIQLPAGEYLPALEKGVCQVIAVFATRESARNFAENFASRYGLKMMDVP